MHTHRQLVAAEGVLERTLVYVRVCVYVFAYVCVSRKAGRGVLQAGFKPTRVSRAAGRSRATVVVV